MAMQRKPQKNTDEKVNEFISEATVEAGGDLAAPKPAEAKKHRKEQDKNEKKSKKQDVKTVKKDAAVIDEQIERRGLFADNFKRETFYVHKDLVKAIKKQAAKGGKGEKTRIINLALKKYFKMNED